MTTAEERLSRLEGEYSHLATNADLSDLKGELKADMADLKGELKADMAELKGELKADMADLKGEFKADMAELKGEFKAGMAELESRLIKWMIGLMIGAAAAASSIAVLVQRLSG